VEPESAERILAGVAIVATAYGALFGGVELLRRVGIGGETTRTIAHVCASLLALGVPLLFGSAWPVVLLAIAFACLMVASRKAGLLGSIHDVSRRTAGAPMYPIGIAAAFVLTGGEAPGSRWPFWRWLGDPAASLTGRRYARRYASVWGVPRSLAGSTAACLVAAAVTATVLLATGEPAAPALLATSLAVGLAVALAEAASPSGLDNVAIPCMAATALNAAASRGDSGPRGARDARAAQYRLSWSIAGAQFAATAVAMTTSAVHVRAGAGQLEARTTSPSRFRCAPRGRPPLAPDHPFLRWRAFSAGEARSLVRVVASLDPRQQVGMGRVGAVGFVTANRDLRTPTLRGAFRAVLEAAEAWLVAGGAVVVRCPVQLATAYGHRVMIGGFPRQGGPPPFPMEPPDIPGLPETLIEAGFGVAHRAASYLVDLDRWIAGERLGEELMRAAGFRDRPVRLDRIEDELATLHGISMAAFRRSWGFSEISLEEFASVYRPLLPLLDPDLVRIAEAPDGRPVGFIFTFPEPAVSGRPDGRFIGKSVAVRPRSVGRHPAPEPDCGCRAPRRAARGYRTASTPYGGGHHARVRLLAAIRRTRRSRRSDVSSTGVGSSSRVVEHPAARRDSGAPGATGPSTPTVGPARSPSSPSGWHVAAGLVGRARAWRCVRLVRDREEAPPRRSRSYGWRHARRPCEPRWVASPRRPDPPAASGRPVDLAPRCSRPRAQERAHPDRQAPTVAGCGARRPRAAGPPRRLPGAQRACTALG
jgi:hypothetical protein